LEGGGAKGIVHVGALRALERRNFAFQGISGTSAGAIVACLKAAGYSANELIDPIHRTTVLNALGTVGKRPRRSTDLFGSNGWWKIRAFRSAIKHGEGWLDFGIRIYLAVIMFFILLGFIALDFELIGKTIIAAAVVSGIALIFGFAAVQVLLRGLADASHFRDQLDVLLTKKVFPNNPQNRVTFGDFGKDGRPDLKIVASDISSGSLRLFSSDNEYDRDIPVADAVTASICLPIVFAPWEVREKLHLDGGLVSNLPVWPFDEERALDPDAVTVAVDILDDDLNPPTKSKWFGHAVRTTIFGASVLNTRAVEQLVIIELSTKLGILDFDVSFDRIATTLREAEQATNTQIAKQIFELPTLFMRACEAARDVTTRSLADVSGAVMVAPDRVGRVRASVAISPKGAKASLRLAYCSGFLASDSDEGILLPIEGSLVGEAYRTGNAILKTAPFPIENNLPGPKFQKLRRGFAPDINWIMAVPIYRNVDTDEGMCEDPKRPAFVVAIDGSDELQEDPEVLEELIKLIGPDIRDLFEPLVEELVS
jgi:NTE family protein